MRSLCRDLDPHNSQELEAALDRSWCQIALPNDLLPKNPIMALLYMLHVAYVAPNETPDPISPQTRKALWAFGNWTACSCGCGRRWNFANDQSGLRDDEHVVKECEPGAWYDAPNTEDDRIAASLFKENVRAWKANKEDPYSPP
jgi:hypothetical protein